VRKVKKKNIAQKYSSLWPLSDLYRYDLIRSLGVANAVVEDPTVITHTKKA
jgi:hypothetical protein